MRVEFLPNLFSQVVFLLAVINAKLLPETKDASQNYTNLQYYRTENERSHRNHEDSSGLKINDTLLYYRTSRQVPNLFQNKQPGVSSSFLNRLSTYGFAITGNIGVGVRYASGNNYHGDGALPHQNHRENTNNVYDRYLGTNFNIGTNLHMLNKADDHSSQNNGLVNRKDEDTSKEFTPDNTTSRYTLWRRLNQYFSKAKPSDSLNGTIIDCNETEDFENCTEVATNNRSTNKLSRFYNKYLSKNEPRKITDNETKVEGQYYALRKVFNDVDFDQNNTNFFNKVTKYFDRYKFSSIVEQIWNDRSNIFPKSGDSLTVKKDYNTFRSTVRDFLIERISSYISQNSTNENFVQKLVKKALSQMMANFQTQETKEQPLDERNIWFKYLSEYFNNERFKKFFPDIETIRNNLTSPQWFEYEGIYASGWLKNNFSHLFNKYFNSNSTQL